MNPVISKKIKEKQETKVPAELSKALEANSKARAQWNDITPIAQRDFITWVESAKQPETHKRRIQVACSKLASGKRRPCCYAIVPMNLYKALAANPKAKDQWSNLTPDERRDFVAWIDSEKTPNTQKRRIEKACALLANGKRHP